MYVHVHVCRHMCFCMCACVCKLVHASGTDLSTHRPVSYHGRLHGVYERVELAANGLARPLATQRPIAKGESLDSEMGGEPITLNLVDEWANRYMPSADGRPAQKLSVLVSGSHIGCTPGKDNPTGAFSQKSVVVNSDSGKYGDLLQLSNRVHDL